VKFHDARDARGLFYRRTPGTKSTGDGIFLVPPSPVEPTGDEKQDTNWGNFMEIPSYSEFSTTNDA
jgi:hypothetical protein